MKPARTIAQAFVVLVVAVAPAFAQTPAPAAPPTAASSSRPFKILDNSFLVEEAFNQEANIFQNILGFVRAGGNWAAVFTQEWPVGGQRHQFSYSLPYLQAGAGEGVGDILINYRLQASTGQAGRPAFSPRISAILPSGHSAAFRGNGAPGVQFNLPFSQQVRDVYVHWNAGLTWFPAVDAPGLTESVSLTSPQIAASAIWRAAPMVHVMVESVAIWEHSASGAVPVRERAITLSPGVRAGWNLGDRQLVLGVAVPVIFAGGTRETGVFLYASYELPFRR